MAELEIVQQELEKERSEASAQREELLGRLSKSDEVNCGLRDQLQDVLSTLLETRCPLPPNSDVELQRLLLKASVADAWPLGALPDSGIRDH